MQYMKFPFVNVLKGKVVTFDDKKVYFLDHFCQHREVLPVIYFLGLDVDGYLIIGYFMNKGAEVMETIMGL